MEDLCGPVSHQFYGTYQYQGREDNSFPLHSEVDVLMDTVLVVKEVAWSMQPSGECRPHHETSRKACEPSLQSTMKKSAMMDNCKPMPHCQFVQLGIEAFLCAS
jgi:hypothetical protein